MTWKNIIGGIVALVFALGFALEITSGSLAQTFMPSFLILGLWVACAYWRYGEGIDEPYNKQQAFMSGGVYAAIVFMTQKPFFDAAIDLSDHMAPILFLAILSFLATRMLFAALKAGMVSLILPLPYWRFFLFQTPIQMRKHTEISDQ
ncbi:MAG: hypothetical protein H0T53_09200 [Herpetosiphonaceae bacterium]|nr:hypothetical protein [Herpetosiphonaceae bacterium]